MRYTLLVAMFVLCGCITEEVRQTADMVHSGAVIVDDNTAADSPNKGNTKALRKLAGAHTLELGDPEEPIEFTSAAAESRADDIEEKAGSTSVPYSWLLLILLVGERGLKALGLGLPKGAIWTVLKYLLPAKKAK